MCVYIIICKQNQVWNESIHKPFGFRLCADVLNYELRFYSHYELL